mgnify:FL=1
MPEPLPIWDEIAEIVKDAPAEELAKLPTDGADRHDFYIADAMLAERRKEVEGE